MAGVKGMKGGGGRRPGSGRKASGRKKVQVTITITPEQRADLDYLKSRAVDTNVVIGREIHRLAIAYDLSDFGFE
jgi:hypothetical protein